MLNPKYTRYADRFRELIEEGNKLAKLERSSSLGPPYIQGEDMIRVVSWLTKARNILEVASDYLTHWSFEGLG